MHCQINSYRLDSALKGVWGRPSPTIGGCSANGVSAEGGLAPLAEVRSQIPFTHKNLTERYVE